MPRSVHTDEYQQLLDVLIDARRAAGLTQSTLATILQKPQSFVSKIETGERRMDVIEFCDWVSGLGQKPSSLLVRFRPE